MNERRHNEEAADAKIDQPAVHKILEALHVHVVNCRTAWLLGNGSLARHVDSLTLQTRSTAGIFSNWPEADRQL